MAVDAGGKLSKWMLLILNTVLLSVGIAMLTLGLWLRSKDEVTFVTTMIETDAFVHGVTVLITVGSVLLAVVLFGDIGVYNESRRALQVFAVLLAFLAASVVVLGVLAYARSDEVGAKLLEFYTTLYALYNYNILARKEDPAIAAALTLFHGAFHCCGVLGGLAELDAVKQTCPKPSTVWEVVPRCPAVIESAIESHALVVMGSFLGTGALLLTALAFTIILIGKIKKGRNSRWTQVKY